MRYDVRMEGGVTRVTVHGSVVYDATTALEKAIRDAFGGGASRVVVDLADCPELSSMAVGLLVGFKIEATLGGGDLHLANPSEQVQRLLEIAGAAESLVAGRPPLSDPGGSRCSDASS
ncbi:MAG: STAS domain-containing protein [Planctomycetes bacterium]|nr:STAS domain-containing protein [Planctomycetota bacterium]